MQLVPKVYNCNLSDTKGHKCNLPDSKLFNSNLSDTKGFKCNLPDSQG